MAYINIKTKGVREITITANYNSLSTWSANKDDVGINNAGSEFNDYAMNSVCGNWANDKIKILSLPNKGYLFYNTQRGGTPSFAPVTVGQEILTKDLIDYKVLKFSAEGESDNQHTGTYITSFTLERFCGAASNNEIVTVNLNMVDLEALDHSFNNGTVFSAMIGGSCRIGNVSNYGESNCQFYGDIDVRTLLGIDYGDYEITDVHATSQNQRNAVSLSPANQKTNLSFPLTAMIDWEWDDYSTEVPTEIRAVIKYTAPSGKVSTGELQVGYLKDHVGVIYN